MAVDYSRIENVSQLDDSYNRNLLSEQMIRANQAAMNQNQFVNSLQNPILARDAAIQQGMFNAESGAPLNGQAPPQMQGGASGPAMNMLRNAPQNVQVPQGTSTPIPQGQMQPQGASDAERVGRQRYAIQQQQLLQAQQEKQQAKLAEEYKLIQPVISSSIEEMRKRGDDEALQGTLKWMSAHENPFIKQQGQAALAAKLKATGNGTTSFDYPITDQNKETFMKNYGKLFGDGSVVPVSGEVYTVKLGQDGKKVESVTQKGDAKEPASTEANYRIGLEDQLKRENPTWSAKRIQFEAAKRVREENKQAQKEKIQFGVTVRGGGMDSGNDGFSSYTPEMKLQAFKDRDLGQYKYPSGMKAISEKKAFDREYYNYRATGGIDASDVAQKRANVGSAKFITKQLDASGSFVKTIDNNIDQLEKHITQMSKTLNLDRNRLLNMGTREFNKKLIGNANINIYDMLVSSISTENAKLQAGGAGSVAQVSEGARTQMEKIHDNNLPVSEMLKLMKATRQEGGNRIKGLRDQLNEINSRTKGSASQAGKKPSFDEYVAHWRKQYPNKSPKDFKAAYDKQFGGQ